MATKPKYAAAPGEKLRACQVLLNKEGGEVVDGLQDLLCANSTDEARIPLVRVIAIALAYLNHSLRKRRSGLRKAVAEVKAIARRSGITGQAQGRHYRARAIEAEEARKKAESNGTEGEAAAGSGEESAA